MADRDRVALLVLLRVRLSTVKRRKKAMMSKQTGRLDFLPTEITARMIYDTVKNQWKIEDGDLSGLSASDLTRNTHRVGSSEFERMRPINDEGRDTCDEQLLTTIERFLESDVALDVLS